MKKLTVTEKVERFTKSVTEHLPVVFCVNCGSTHLDQNFISQIRCYDCGNVSNKWDGNKFGIARNKNVFDVANAVKS